MKSRSFATVPALLALLLPLGAALPAQAQYKIVGPDGKVTYTDRAPLRADGKITALGSRAVAPAADVALPAELRQAASRYPVLLYVSLNACEPCDLARQLLRQRGIPHGERQVQTSEDGDALEKLTGGRDAPTLTIGSQTLRGLSPEVWNSYLDAAGYPRESRLPPGYQFPAAAPIAERREAPRTVAQRPAAPASAVEDTAKGAAGKRPTRRASRLPAATAAPITQNSTGTPSAAPATPNSSGIVALEKLIVIERSAIASPCRSCGVNWCSVVMIIGCTEPSARPSRTASVPINQADRTNG
jgi:glutaredoxin